jgi:hypothetical protein
MLFNSERSLLYFILFLFVCLDIILFFICCAYYRSNAPVAAEEIMHNNIVPEPVTARFSLSEENVVMEINTL